MKYGGSMAATDPKPGAPALTVRQQRIVSAIQDSLERRGYPPTVREIASAVGLSSPSSVAHHLGTLERLGVLRRGRRGPRAVDIRALAGTLPTGSVQDAVMVPVLGMIAAGLPVLAVEHVEDELCLARQLVGYGTLFALRVTGDSMVEA